MVSRQRAVNVGFVVSEPGPVPDLDELVVPLEVDERVVPVEENGFDHRLD